MNGQGLAAAARLLHARHLGADAVFRSVSIDTRTLEAGALFVAVRGPRFDGHDFVAEAEGRGAAGAMVSRAVQVRCPQLVVRDTRAALGALAAHRRANLAIPVVAITGSNGKTTVKELVAAILGVQGEVLATRGNLNNDLGVPLTLLRIGPAHRYAVIEMGANHPGEIAGLSRIAVPTVALITNAGPAHLEGFGSVEGVARAKGEIFQGLRAGGVAVINADDVHAGLWRSLAEAAGCRVSSFGAEHPAAVRAVRCVAQADATTRFALETPAGSVDIHLPLPGRHNVLNAAAAAAAALAAGVDLAAIRRGLESARGVAGRLQTQTGVAGARLIDDTYNANPGSLRAALETLTTFPGVHWLVLGDMGELGAEAPGLHADAGRVAREVGVERLFAVGALSRDAVQAFGPGARHFSDRDALVTAVRAALRPEVTVLIKGSRFMGMERVVQALQVEAGR